jgi:hypothetical protein
VDDRSFKLAIGALGASVVALGLDAVVATFQVPPGFWAVPPGVLTYLATRNRKGDGD